MAIEFNCPHCAHPYKLKDELAGKTATCKTCRQKITIPSPVTVPEKTAAEIEAEALAAMADEPAKVEQEEAKKVVPVECPFCNHKWTEPITRAGKNALCPNPECKQRVKIPEPKDEGQYDWRQTKTKGPSLAKDNQQKLEGVQDAGQAQIVSGTALKEAGAIDEDIEPRPLKQKVMFALVAVGMVFGLGYGGCYLSHKRTAGKEDTLTRDAQEELTKGVDALPKDEAPLFLAAMHSAAGEHALRHDTKEKLREGMDEFGKAREDLRAAPPSAARTAAVGELAVASLEMGGTDEQVREGTRLRWTPDTVLKVRPNERVFTVFEELNKTLDLIAATDLDYRVQLARRLTRELVKRGRAAMADQLLPAALFAPPERAEARAVVALEIYRADKNSDLPRKVAQELAARGAELAKGVPAPSVQTLLSLMKINTPMVVPPATGVVQDAARYAYTGLAVLEDRAADALKLVQAPGKPEPQLRCLTLWADWAADPTDPLNAAAGIVSANAGNKEVKLSPWALLRLSEIAAEKGRPDLVKKFADAMPDEGLKACAMGAGIRLRLAAAPKEKGDVSWSELPDDPKKFRAGQAWGRLALARHNARLSGNRAEEVKTVTAWPAPFSSFGKAGVALGLQDRDK
jgi:hypothetical protein